MFLLNLTNKNNYPILNTIRRTNKIVLFLYDFVSRNILYFLLFLIFSFFIPIKHATAQYLELKSKVQRIDSLTERYFADSDKANKEVDELYVLLDTKFNSKEYQDLKIDVMLQQSIIRSLNGKHHEALKIALAALEIAEKYNIPEKAYRSCWIIALMYEIGDDLIKCRDYLDKAYSIYKKNKLDYVFSAYCIRMSSYFIQKNQNDSSLFYARKGLDTALKYNNKREIRDAYLLLGGLLTKSDYVEAAKYRSLAAKEFIEIEDFSSAAIQYSAISLIYLKYNLLKEALLYSDSAMNTLYGTTAKVNPYVYKVRSNVYEKNKSYDSAFSNFVKYHNLYVNELNEMETSKIKEISEKYQNDKNTATIKNKDQKINNIVILLALIFGASILLIQKNRKILKQNKIINNQITELSKVIEQKQILLSELQHRVKNNLQHVISILEIQKESVGFNNIEELIRENQNRIHSMALLHKKLNVNDNANEVNLKSYIEELSHLVKNSYEINNKKITLSVLCKIENVHIEKASTIGLIITELISNSMKHAFVQQNTGEIYIEFTLNKNTKFHRLIFMDNGVGFDFNKQSDVGLGHEITKGLIEQLNGSIETQSDNGFKLIVYFK